MKKTHLASLLTATLMTGAPTWAAEPEAASYGARLEGFEYAWPVALHGFESQRQTLEMAYLDIAPTVEANGRTVLLLHGKNFCAGTWEATIHALIGAGFRVIAPDQVGFCKSTKPMGYQFSFQQLAANTAGLLDALGVDKVTVLGHSMGGMLATRFARQYPARVEQLMMVNPIGLEDWQAKGVPYATVDTAYAGELKTNFDGIKAYQLRFYYNGEWKPEYDRWVHMLAGMYNGPGKEVVAWNQAQTSDMVFTQPVVHEFNQLTMPVTLFIGGLDRTAPGANRASAELAQTLGAIPRTGPRRRQGDAARHAGRIPRPRPLAAGRGAGRIPRRAARGPATLIRALRMNKAGKPVWVCRPCCLASLRLTARS